MIRRIFLTTAIALCGASLASAQEAASSKVGIIHIQNAMLSTKDGQKAAADLQAKFEPTSKRLQGLRDEINALQAEVSKGSNTMGEERRIEISRQIDQKTRSLNRASEDAQADFQAEQDKILQDLGQRMMAVIGKYSRDNGYTLVLDVSNPQTPVLFAENGIDITQDIIKLYDEESAAAAASASAAPAPSTPQ